MISNILSAQVVKHKKMFRVISCARYVIGITTILSLTSSGLAAQTSEDTPNWQASDQNVQGIDVSHYQGIVNWNEVKQQGIVFAFMKATGGNTYTDPELADNWHFSREPEKILCGHCVDKLIMLYTHSEL